MTFARPESVRSVPLIEDLLADLHRALAGVADGQVADYIPELGKSDPSAFGLALATTNGQTYGVGDADQAFTIQSVSKPFMYGYALREYGAEFVLGKVGVEPTGEAFNSIVLDAKHNRPFNPMVNAGAIAIAALMKGETRAARNDAMLAEFDRLAGRELTIDDAVFRSELATGHRNRAIAYMMLNTAMIEGDADEILDLYFRQCSVLVTARDLAVMAATLANDGVNPLTGVRALDAPQVRDVLTVMSTCGMYDYAGQWAFEVGMPAKSGVSGAIIAVIPGQGGIGVFSPPLDEYGNSVRGILACQRLSREFGLHSHASRPGTPSVIRREYRGNSVHSKRLRSPAELAVLEAGGGRVVVLELQGTLFFGTCERLARRIDELAGSAEYIILDFRRVHSVDSAALHLIGHLCRARNGAGPRVMATHLPGDDALAELTERIAACGVALYQDTDRAFEWCDERLLEAAPEAGDRSKWSLEQLDIFRGLDRGQCRLLESIVQTLQFEPGETIIREGDPAQLFFVLARGSATVSLAAPGGQRHRLACIGPGMSFGEMALLDGGARSADVIADERAICYGFSVDGLRELNAAHPAIMITILGNLVRDFSDRLRRANLEIRALE